MFEIKVTDEFSAAHNLRGYHGRCEELHGHNWRIEAVIRGEGLGKIGMLMDFKQLKSLLSKILDRLDHKYLNRLSYFRKLNPTSENIARCIYNMLKPQISPNKSAKLKASSSQVSLKSVTVWENSTSCVTYTE